MSKKTAIEQYNFSLSAGKMFLIGQLELYKIEFTETGNNDYLKVMNDFNETIKLLETMDGEILRLSKHCRRLYNENKQLK
jgi:hypothetical protein